LAGVHQRFAETMAVTMTSSERHEFVHPAKPGPRVLAYATQGAGSDDEARLRELLRDFDTVFMAFQRKNKRESFFEILRLGRQRRFDVVCMEGSGFAGGAAAIWLRVFHHLPYVVSSGDAIGPFLSARFPFGAPIFWLYERWLYTNASGFIGWTPYLTGRSLTMGASKAMTAPGWAPHVRTPEERTDSRRAIRSRFGIPMDAIVFGMAGSLNWSPRFQYCYGMELVLAATRAKMPIYVLIVGDGTGLSRLRTAAGGLLDKTILLPGKVSREEVPDYLAAMDIGSLPQSVDRVGVFRYTTKVSEYMAEDLPFVTTQIPLAYDLDRDNLWRLPGSSPWDPKFVDALTNLMNTVDQADIANRKHPHSGGLEFDREQQIRRVSAFLHEIDCGRR
jgi:glycosyltransferase involved in cell wall biosynthesis